MRKSRIKYFKCHNYGHYANRCPRVGKKEAHHVRAEETEPSVLLVETVELGPLEHTLQTSLYLEVYLEEMKLTPELTLHWRGGVHGQCLVPGQ